MTQVGNRFEDLAQAELERADDWAQGDADKDDRNEMIEHALHRATVYALLSIAQQISMLEAHIGR